VPAILFIRSVLVRDWRFLAVTMASCMVAATVATFQYAVYNSFRQASAVVPRVLGADYWVTAGSVECFDFPAPFSEDYGAALSRYLPGSAMRRVVFGFAPWRSPQGRRGNVALVGVEGLGIGPTGFVANRSDFSRLDIPDSTTALVEASIGEKTLVLEDSVETLPTYLGAPYVLADFETARSLLRMDPGSVAFLAGNFNDGMPPDFEAQTQRAASRFPDVSITSADAFAASSIAYWEKKTGAGLAIGLAAVLALLLMILLLANGVLRFIQRYYADLLSLLGHGASSRDIGQIVSGVGLAIAAITLAGTAIITPLMVLAFRPLLPWTGFQATDLFAPLLGVTAALGAAHLSARRALAAFGPDAVFRS
jgi:putative ABC transport system permease protein